jgi:hypothetical protein
VAFTDGVKLAGDDELLGGILADRLEQLILPAAALLQQERLLDEPGSEVCDPRRGLTVAPADLLDRREVEPAGEHCHPPQEVPLPPASRTSLHSTVARSGRCAPSARRADCGSKSNRSSR